MYVKILVVCQHYAPEPFRLADICEELARRGHKLTVLTGIPNYPEGKFYPGYGLFRRRKERVGGVEVRRSIIFPRGRGRNIELVLNYASFMFCAALRALGTGRGRYDAVLAYQLTPVTMAYPAMIAARRSRAPLITYICDLWPESLDAVLGIGEGLLYRIVRRFVDKLYKESDALFVTSRGFIEPLVMRGHYRERIRYLPQYPEELYSPAEVSPDDPVRREVPAGFVVAFTGNIGFAQGLETMLQASAILKGERDLWWLVIGDGRAARKLSALAAELGVADRVRFLGRKPKEAIPSYLALCDVAFLSLSKKPLFSMTVPAKLQSYLACGMPILGSLDGEAAEVVREAGAGLCGPAEDAEALAANVLRLRAASEAERKVMGTRARAYFEAHFRKGPLMDTLEASLEVCAKVGRHG